LYVGMPRKLRIEYPGAMYHVMSRDDRRERIFLNDVDRQDFVKTMAEACQKTNWQVHAYCLMPNHYHLVLETPEPSLVAGMARLRRETTLSTKAIAARVHLGSSKAANRSLHSYMRGGAVASAGQGQLGI
jgi:REP element-mobilizing transposase RayT